VFGVQSQQSLHHKPFGPHRFPPMRERPWHSISMDFIEGPTLSDGHDTILWSVPPNQDGSVMSTSGQSMLKTWLIYLVTVLRKWDPDRHHLRSGQALLSRFAVTFASCWASRPTYRTAYHPETDGQTERVNQVLEQYLQVTSTTTRQLGQPPTLGRVAYNNTSHSATMVTPFFTTRL